MTTIYRITDLDVETIISNQWSIIYEKAICHLNNVIDKTAIMKKALTSKKSLDNFNDILLDDQYFKMLRKAMHPYTHRLKDLIIQQETDPSIRSLSEDNLKKLKEIQSEANFWYVSFNNAVSSYRTIRQTYEIAYINRYGKMI